MVSYRRYVTNKIIRDGLLKTNGKYYQEYIHITDTRILKDLLKKKLVEEANEVLEARDVPYIIEELADVNEVIQSIMKIYGISKYQVELARTVKRESKGGFDEGLYLQTFSVPAEDNYNYQLEKKYTEIPLNRDCIESIKKMKEEKSI
jgi:predicted house-cleaning noncanonical NTP pyrophosphatase (MazG superfamily)